MKKIGSYFKVSLIFHVIIIVILLVSTAIWSEGVKKRVKLVVIPKGTDPNAVLTQEYLDKMRTTPLPADGDEKKNELKTNVTPLPATPAATPTATPKPTASPTPKVTPKLSPRPKKVEKPTPTPTPKKKTKTTPTPDPKAKKSSSNKKTTPTPKATLRPTGKPTATPSPTPDRDYVYDPDSAAPIIATPAGAQVQKELKPGQKAGIPGIANGVEGAPMPIDKIPTDGPALVTAQWAGAVRMKIQSCFSVPPGVDRPDKSCEVEWEVLRDGTIRNARVRRSSGVAALDSCALNAVMMAAKVEPLPPEIDAMSVWTSITFQFGL